MSFTQCCFRNPQRRRNEKLVGAACQACSICDPSWFPSNPAAAVTYVKQMQLVKKMSFFHGRGDLYSLATASGWR